MMKAKLLAGTAVSLLAVLATSASAEEARDVALVDEIVVVGARQPTKISDLPSAAIVLNEAEIQQQARIGVPLKELLGTLVPGLDAGPQGRTNYGQNLRGRSVLVMIDGVTLNESRSLSRQFDSIDPFNIARVEVLSGASSVYGGGATGGIINIITKRGKEGGPAFELEAGARSGLKSGDLDKRIAAGVSGGNDKITGRIAVAAQKNGAAYDADGVRIKPDITQTDLQGNLSTDVQGELAWNIAPNHSLRLFGQFYESHFDSDEALYLGPNLAGAIGGRPDLLAVRGGFTSDLVPSTKRRMGSIDYTGEDILGGQTLLIQAYGRTEKSAFYPFPASATYTLAGVRRSLNAYGASQQNTDLFGVKSALNKDFGSLSVTYGVDYTSESFNATQTLFDTATAFASGGMTLRRTGEIGRYPSFDVKTPAFFGQAEWKALDNLTINGGVRHERANVHVDTFVAYAQQLLIANGIAGSADAIPGGSNDYNVTLFNAGAVYSFAPGQQAWFNYSEGFELPDPAKYYGTGTYANLATVGSRATLISGINVGTQPLAGIKTKQFEVGTRFAEGPVSLQASAFYALSDKTIQFVPLTLNLLLVDQKVRTYGLEGSADLRLAHGLSIGMNGLAVRSEQQTAGTWKKQTVTLASPSKFTAYVAKQFDQASVRFQTTTTFSLKDDVGGKLDGYTTLDLLADYKVGPGTISFGIQNLLNESYTTIWGQRAVLFYTGLVSPEVVTFKGRGRTYGLSFNANF